MDPQAQLAKSVVDQMSSQVDLLTTIAAAIFGGLAAFFVKGVFEADHDQRRLVLQLEYKLFAYLALISEGIAVFLGYLTRGSITANTPAIFGFKGLKDLNNLNEIKIDGYSTLRNLAVWQIIVFGVGILFILLFIMFNLGFVASAADRTSQEDAKPSKTQGDNS